MDNEPSSIAVWQASIFTWLKTMGFAEVTTAAHVRHMREETEEYYRAYLQDKEHQTPATRREMGAELADIVFIVLGQAALQGIDLEMAMIDKFGRNLSRTALPLGSDGIRRLSKEEGP